MAITIKGLRDGSGSVNQKGETDYDRTYRVHTTDKVTEDENAVLTYFRTHGFEINSPHPTDPLCVVSGLTARTVTQFADGGTEGLLWDVTVQFGPPNAEFSEAEGDPLDQTPRFRLEPVGKEEALFVDIDGNAIVNSVGDPFDPPLVDEVFDYILTVNRYERFTSVDINAIMYLSARSRLNNALWNTFPEKTVKSLPLRVPELQWSRKYSAWYLAMEYQFHIKLDTWTRKVVNQGMGELYDGDGSGEKRRNALDSSGMPVQNPILLDEDGFALPVPVNPADVVILEFEVNEAIDFGIFGLDNVFVAPPAPV